jgi:hypothetical protein
MIIIMITIMIIIYIRELSGVGILSAPYAHHACYSFVKERAEYFSF